ncbi:ComF family protein [Desulfobaculum bizertense]|uniref:ComF family protein n=1 Tax=Desulfobaculum bizertense DSM 18034 TaxID=1121442 RepID=A0A1T4WLJ4_9BACT|nr:ComF family protein [Desulfobaculum bizertense]SKA78202.1 comF family protein [Desulfobaculum bizertense DSM 18034]
MFQRIGQGLRDFIGTRCVLCGSVLPREPHCCSVLRQELAQRNGIRRLAHAVYSVKKRYCGERAGETGVFFRNTDESPALHLWQTLEKTLETTDGWKDCTELAGQWPGRVQGRSPLVLTSEGFGASATEAAPSFSQLWGGLLCSECQARLRIRLGGYCPVCGEMYADAEREPWSCGACRRSPRPWSALHFFAAYDDVLRQLILDYKFSGRLGLGRVLQHCLVMACLRDGWPDGDDWIVVPVPLHASRLAWRGFNQSLELARGLGAFGVSVCSGALERIIKTRPQLELSAGERRTNLRGAFAADASQVMGKRVLLVDDVMTTGGTLEAAGKALLRAGVRQLEACVLARTGPR